MASLLHARFWRFAFPAACVLVSTVGLTSAAAQQQQVRTQPRATGPAQTFASKAPSVVTVPDVRGQVYVFAKGILEQTGFAWRVEGGVDGFAVNLVGSQRPAAGTRVVDTGAPTISLQLNRNTRYAETGVPENFAPYLGTRVVLPRTTPARKPAAKPRPEAKKPKRATKPAVKKRPAKKQVRKQPTQRPAQSRPRAFHVSGAPKEPLDEMPLPRRARMLGAWLDSHPRPTDANVAHWVYQHAWIVTGARFGWWRGAEALRILIKVDNRVISTWGIGTQSRATARAALAEVKARSS